MRFFNTAGPCDERFHYMVPAAARLPEVPWLIDRGGWLVVRAPRQSGKTTTLRAIARELTAAGRHAALHFSCEVAAAAGDDFGAAQEAILAAIRARAGDDLPPELRPPAVWPAATDLDLLGAALSAWAAECPRPLVLFFDEIDAVTGASLRAVLGQLRANYDRRPGKAPWSVTLCGLRDVREYKAASGGDPTRLGTASPFNIKVESIRLGDFTPDEVRALYAQLTAETGQPFTDQAVERAWEVTQGQPWLTNALAREITEKLAIPPPTPITDEHIESARERLILARATHLDSLVARLQEPRVRRIIEPLLAGGLVGGDTYDDDFTYVRDLGLIAQSPPPRVANPIYREVIVRVLAAAAEANVPVEPRRFVQPDGRLDVRQMASAFVDFWREHGDVLIGGLPYAEVAPQLVLMAFLQRVVNGGGFVDREYGVGRGRIDVLVRWPFRGPGGDRAWQRVAVEMKVWRDKRGDPLGEGLKQLDAYLGGLGLDAGVLALFDRRTAAAPIEERAGLEDHVTPAGRTALVLRA